MPPPDVLKANSVDDAGNEEWMTRMPMATILVMAKNINNEKVMMTGSLE